EAGACGFNLEDTDHRAGVLVGADQHAERIAEIKAACRTNGVELVVNARVDVHLQNGPIEEGLRRAQKYFDAGADCVYPILLSDVTAIREYVALGPINVFYRPGGTALRELVKLGVARISVGPSLFRLLLKRLEAAVEAFRNFDDEGIWK